MVAIPCGFDPRHRHQKATSPFGEVAFLLLWFWGSNGSGSEWDEGENATGRRFHPRSNENKELKERAMPRRATTIFSEVDLNGRQSRDWDEAKNATEWRFCARSHENRKPKEAAMPRHAATIFSEVKSRGGKAKFTRLS